MKRDHDCITDPVTRQWWREYRREVKKGNPLGLSFTEYVAHRVLTSGTQIVYTAVSDSPWYVSACGHKHAWGEACGTYTTT